MQQRGFHETVKHQFTRSQKSINLKNCIRLLASPQSVKYKFCRNCYETNESPEVYKSHYLLNQYAEIQCPKVIREGCPICGERGKNAHIPEMCENRLTTRTTHRYKSKMRKAVSLRLILLKKLGKKCMKAVKRTKKLVHYTSPEIDTEETRIIAERVKQIIEMTQVPDFLNLNIPGVPI